MIIVDRLLLMVLIGGLLAIGMAWATAAPVCHSLKQARRLHPNVHLYRQGQCWGVKPKKRVVRRAEVREQIIVEETEPPPPIKMIEPWRAESWVTDNKFIPWTERIEPHLHQGGK